MILPRVRFTVRGMMIALVPVIAGSLVVGSLVGISAELAIADALIFGVSYSAVAGLAAVIAARCYRQSRWPRPRWTLASVSVLVVMAWGAVEWPHVRGWAYHAQCEYLFSHDRAMSLLHRGEYPSHSELRRRYQRAMVQPWKTVPPW
jgi:hypothetical protein